MSIAGSSGRAEAHRSCAWMALVGLLLTAGPVAWAGCAGEGAPSTQVAFTASASATAAQSDVPEVLATIGDEPITMADVRARVGVDLDKIETQYLNNRHNMIQTTLETILQERVLQAEAENQGTTVEALVLDEAGGTFEPGEVEIAAWYSENPAQVGGRTLDQVRVAIANYLRGQRRTSALRRLAERLSDERGVQVHLEPFRVDLNTSGAPATGPDDAPITLVLFSDFECPYCGTFFPTIQRVLQTYPDDVRLVYKQFPLSNLHPRAFKAAEASLCADEQDRFWEFHDLLFREQQQLTVRDLKEKAGRLGLDQGAFDACLDSGRQVERIQEELSEGSRVGVTGTPAAFVNGILINGGAVPYETVAAAIEKELERTKR